MSDFVIKTTELGHRYRNLWAVRDLDLTVPRGSVFGLLGANGAGKSTTIHMLMGLLVPTAGSMEVLGYNPIREAVPMRQRVGYVPETHGFYEWMRVDQLVSMVAAYHCTWNHRLCDELTEEFSLDPGARIDSLSRGMRAKLALLLALSFEPEILILDEPASGLDAAARRSFIETILARYQNEGKTIVVSSHLLNEFSGLIDQVAFLQDGRIAVAADVDGLHRRMKRVHLQFDQDAPNTVSVPGTLSYKASGRDGVLILDQFDESSTPAALTALSPATTDVTELTLEDIFVELVNA